MRKGPTRFLCIGLACLFVASPAPAAETGLGKTVVLILPRAASKGEAVWVEIRAGLLERGTEIQVEAVDGSLLGSVSPFAVPPGTDARYTIPLPRAAIVDNHVELRLSVAAVNAKPRPPAPGEVRDIRLIYVPVDR